MKKADSITASLFVEAKKHFNVNENDLPVKDYHGYSIFESFASRLCPRSIDQIIEALRKGQHTRDCRSQEYWQHQLSMEALFSAAVQDQTTKFCEKTEKVLQIMRFSRLVPNSRFAMVESYRSDSGWSSLILISNEDRYGDYDPSYIRSALGRKSLFEKIFGLKTSEADSFYRLHDHSGGPYHYVDIDDVIEEIKMKLETEAKKEFQKFQDAVDGKEKTELEKEEKKRAEAIQETVDHLQEAFGCPDDQLKFFSMYLAEQPCHIPSAIKNGEMICKDGFLVFSHGGFEDDVTRSTVTSYTVRRVHVLNGRAKKVIVSPKEKVLWRTTARGVIRNALETKMSEVSISEGKVKIFFTDSDNLSLDLDKATALTKPSETLRKKVQEFTESRVREMKEAHKGLSIPVYGEGMPQIQHRSADAGVASTEFSDDGKSALVKLWEDIDYRAGGSSSQIYVVQKRVTTYRVAEDSIESLGSETQWDQ